MVILSLAFFLFLFVLVVSCRPPSPYRYLVRREGGRERNQALLSMRPHEASPHQTKRARPHCASLGIFNTAGYEVLIALFLTSQIPSSICLSPPHPLLFYSFSLFLCFSLQTFSVPIFLSLLCHIAPLYCLSLLILNLSLPVQLFYCLFFFSLCISCSVSHERGHIRRESFLC